MRNRRAFIGLMGGAAAWPVAAPAQQPERVRRISVLMALAADDPQSPVRIAALSQGLQELGWTIGRNVRVDYRFGAANAENARKYAAVLAALPPDVALANGSPVVAALQQGNSNIPVVFVTIADPLGAGFIDSMARPGGNVTGFISYEYGTSGKWLELLKEIAPGVRRAAVLRDAALATGSGQLGAIASLAPSFGVELRAVGLRDPSGIENDIAAFARGSDGGLIVTGSGLAVLHRDLITALAARYRLPAVYSTREFVNSGGLISYGADAEDQFRRAASYVDRILRGEKPGDLPVQSPTKYELVINLKTAKALGLEVPSTLLARADEVIE